MMFTFFGVEDLETTLSTVSTTVTLAGGGLIVLLLLLAIALGRDKRRNKHKLPLFAAIVTLILGVTATITANTIYLNVVSATGGPVHWHADVEIWACGNELELRNPTGLSNKVGTPTLHEHNDKRIHLEGVPVDLPHDASLAKFMSVIGGGVSKSSLVVPLSDGDYFENNQGEEDGDGPAATAPELIDAYIHTEANGKVATFVSGEKCGNEAAQVQIFALQFNEADNTYTQTKIEQPDMFDIAPDETVPPGDCVIIEFSAQKDRTDKLCKQYGIRDIDRCQEFGVAADKRAVCDIREKR